MYVTIGNTEPKYGTVRTLQWAINRNYIFVDKPASITSVSFGFRAGVYWLEYQPTRFSYVSLCGRLREVCRGNYYYFPMMAETTTSSPTPSMLKTIEAVCEISKRFLTELTADDGMWVFQCEGKWEETKSWGRLKLKMLRYSVNYSFDYL